MILFLLLSSLGFSQSVLCGEEQNFNNSLNTYTFTSLTFNHSGIVHVVNSLVLSLKAWLWPCSLTPLQEQKNPNAGTGLIFRKSLFIYLFLVDIKLGKKKTPTCYLLICFYKHTDKDSRG